MDNKISFVLDGITIQHAGELLLDNPYTVTERGICSNTYVRCLEDFCFSYTYGSFFAHTKKFPPVKDSKPGEDLCDEFGNRFFQLNDKGQPSLFAFLDDEQIIDRLTIDMQHALKAYIKKPSFYNEWIIREAKAHLGNDESIFKELNPPELYIFDKDPDYLHSRKLQNIIPEKFLGKLSKEIKGSLKNPHVSQNAINEFISRSFLTHQLIYWWYSFIVEKNTNMRNIQVPHITRSLLRFVVGQDSSDERFKQLKDVLVQSALYDALKKSHDRDILITRIKEQSETPPYPYLRSRLEDIFEETDQKDFDKKLKSILKEINRYIESKSIFDFVDKVAFTIPTPFGIPAPEIKVPLQLLIPNKSAFRKIVKQYYPDDYYIKLTKIFKELDINKF